MDNAPQLINALYEKPEVATAIAGLPPHLQFIEIGRIAARLEAAKAKPAVSNAPPPTPKVVTSDVSTDPDPSKMTRVQYAKWREQHGG
jgi:hypothetical protein